VRSSRRSRLLLSLAAALSIAVAGLACGGDDGGGGDSGEAKALLERAFAKQVGSGELELDVKADLEGGGEKLEGPMTLKIDGPYAQSTRRKLPRLDWDISFKGLGQNIRGGLIATADNGFVELQGETFELGEQTFASLARQYAAVQPARRQSLGTFGIDAASWLKDPELHEDGESIGGEPTREITGSVDVRKAVRDIVELTRSPRLRRQLERQGQPAPELPRPKDEDLDEIEDAVNEFDIEVNVDKNDVVRRFFTEIAFDVPGEQDGDDVDGGRVSLRYVLRKVNTSPVIRPPQNPKPLRQLLEGFGLGALGGGLDRR
jgi:hypothetical protein